MSDHRLEQAIVAVSKAVDGYGLRVRLIQGSAHDVQDVREALHRMAAWIADNNRWIGEANEEAAVRNLALLANLYAEHLCEREHEPP